MNPPRPQITQAMADHEPTESSPLLSSASTAYFEPADAPEGPLASSTGGDGHSTGKTMNGDEEGQLPEDGRTHQYEGMPEVKKQLKYILPAIAIGVRIYTQSRRSAILIWARYSYQHATRQSSCLVMARLVAI